MRSEIKKHWEIFTEVFGQRWLRIPGLLLTALCLYDLFLSQALTEEFAKKWPRLHEIVAMTGGWLPWWAWGWIATAFAAAVVFEYAVRLHARTVREWPSYTTKEVRQKLWNKYHEGVELRNAGAGNITLELAKLWSVNYYKWREETLQAAEEVCPDLMNNIRVLNMMPDIHQGIFYENPDDREVADIHIRNVNALSEIPRRINGYLTKSL
jgi:hypothetical protein